MTSDLPNMLASVDQLEVRLGRDLLENERPRVEAILQDITAVALGETGATWTAETAPPDVRAVILSAALRTFKNPDRYVEQRIGGFAARVDRTEFTAGMFTKAELDILQRNSQREGFGSLGFSTVARYRDDGPGGDIEYWESSIPGSPIPYVERPY